MKPFRFDRGRFMVAILLLAVILRVGVAFYLGNIVDAPPLLTDQRSYHALGASLIAGKGFSFDVGWYPFTAPHTPTAHWSFLYSLWVAAVYAVFGPQPLAARMAGAIAGGILLPWAVYRLAGRLGVEGLRTKVEAVGLPWYLQPSTFNLQLLSTLLAAGYFYFVLYAATLMTETFFITALLWSLERAMALGEVLRARPGQAAARGRWPVVALGLGVSLGIATLLRQSILPWVAVMSAWLIWLGMRSGQARRALQALAVAVAVVGLMVLPFTVRNYRAYGQFLLLNSNAGYAMYSAQHPMHGTQFQEFAAAPLPADLVKGNEAQMDRDLLRRGIGFVLAEPGRYLLLCLSRARAYFEFWPSSDTTLLHNVGRVGSFGLFLPFMIYGTWLAVRRAAGGWLDKLSSSLGLALGFMAFYSLLHIATWAMPRYRLPVDTVALIFAALALQTLLVRAWLWWTGRSPAHAALKEEAG